MLEYCEQKKMFYIMIIILWRNKYVSGLQDIDEDMGNSYFNCGRKDLEQSIEPNLIISDLIFTLPFNRLWAQVRLLLKVLLRSWKIQIWISNT